MRLKPLLFALILVVKFVFATPVWAAANITLQGLNSANYSLNTLLWSKLGRFSGGGTLLVTDPAVTKQLRYNPSRSWSNGSYVVNIMQVGDTYQFDGDLIPWGALIPGDPKKLPIAKGFPIWNNVSLRDLIALNPALAKQAVSANLLTAAIAGSSQVGASAVDYRNKVKAAIVKHSRIINQFVKNNPWSLEIPIGSLLQGNWEGRLTSDIRSALTAIIQQFPTLANVSLNGLIQAANVTLGRSGRPSLLTRAPPYLVAGPVVAQSSINQTNGQFSQSNPGVAAAPIATQVNTATIPTVAVPVSTATPIGSIPGAGGQPVSQAGTLPNSTSPAGTAKGAPSVADIFKIGIADFDLADRISGKAGYALTGGTKNQKFKPKNCDGKVGKAQKKGGKDNGDCANIEINNSLTLQGLVTQAINSNVDGVVDGMQLVHKKQIVEGGSGVLGKVNNGKEPTGWKPWGMKPPVKLVIAKINDIETEADLELYFQICVRKPVDLGCTPHFLGPVPAPPPFSPVKDKGPIIITTVNKPPPIPPQFGGFSGCGSAGSAGAIPAPSTDPNAPLSQQNLKRYLDRIAAGESAGGTNLGPNYLGAYGKYQFIPSTRQAILNKYGYDAWNPAQWDQAAIALIKDVGGQSLLDTIASGNFTTADASLNRTWTSLPGGAEQSPLWSNPANLVAYGPINNAQGATVTAGSNTNQQQTQGVQQVASAAGGSACVASGPPIPCPPGKPCLLHHPIPAGSFVRGFAGSHYGLDISSVYSSTGPGAPILAVDDGQVIATPDFFSGCKNYGYRIEINHPGRSLVSTYNHLYSRNVAPGTQVKRGQKIAVEGATSCGMYTHLHYELQTGPGLRNGIFDPMKVQHEPPIR
jgi:murein DD-endopeptidase MepM/ murein hydrolase activator NlpD